MYRSSSTPDHAPTASPALTCLPLDLSHAIEPEATDVCVFVLPGACILQRQVAGQWLDVQAIYRGAIVVTRLAGPLRISSMSVPGAIALRITNPVAESPFARLSERDEATPSLQLEADAVIDSLVQVLSMAARVSAPCVREPIIEALSRRLAVLLRRHAVQAPGKQLALPAWRLRRVVDLVKERIDEAISLADMAAAAGLSPMHFAAQFKVATGMRPHHYLIAERIGRAKQLLDETTDTIMDIAIAVGFQTQAHFATVFKQHENVTPRQWRGARGVRPQTAQRATHRARAGASRNGVEPKAASARL